MEQPDNYSPDLGDWRLMTSGWVTAMNGEPLETPKAFRASTWYAAPGKSEFSFPTPSAAALHLNAAWRAANRAYALKAQLAIHVFMNDQGQYAFQSSEEHTALLFDYFEEMIATAFGSFGAIEAYCNQVLIERATGPITLKRKKGEVVVPPEEAERDAPTEEKLKRIVPRLLGIPTPSGGRTWDAFLRIKRVRDAITHFKRKDQMRGAHRAHEPTVLLDLYTLDCFDMPEDAMTVLRYLQQDKLQRWMVNPAWKRAAPLSMPPQPE